MAAVAERDVLGKRVFRSAYDPPDLEAMRAALAAGGLPDWVDVSRRVRPLSGAPKPPVEGDC